MADEEHVTEEPIVTTDDADVETEATALAVEMGGNKMVPLSALIGAKKELKSLGKRVKELEPVAARVTDVEDRLDKASPLISALVNNPKLRAEALRIANSTRTSADTTDQPTADDDPEAVDVAANLGFFLADGQTPDVARARRVLEYLDKRHGLQTDAKMRPLAGTVLGSRADENVRAVMQMRDEDGVPYATEESIREVVQMMGLDGQHLLANPRVAEVVLRSAIGEDRLKKRTPKPVDEPMYLDSAGSGRRRSEPSLTAEERASATKLGLTEKDLIEAGKKLQTGRGIILGR